jgi:hypothetical protein
VPRLVAREQPQPRPKADAAISKTSACGDTLSATPHQSVKSLQRGLCANTFELRGQATEWALGVRGLSVHVPH